MITIDGGTGVIMNNGVEVASEKMVDEWRTTGDQSNGSGVVVVDEYWERNDSYFALIGKSMTESSGVFSFPLTGIYLVTASASFYSSSGAMEYQGCLIQASTDNFSSSIVIGNNYSSSGNTNYYSSTTAQAVFDVTDLSTHKVRLATNFPGTGGIQGSTVTQRTCFNFTRLGST